MRWVGGAGFEVRSNLANNRQNACILSDFAQMLKQILVNNRGWGHFGGRFWPLVCMQVQVGVHVDLHVCVGVCACTCTHMRMQVSTCTDTCTCMHTRPIIVLSALSEGFWPILRLSTC